MSTVQHCIRSLVGFYLVKIGFYLGVFSSMVSTRMLTLNLMRVDKRDGYIPCSLEFIGLFIMMLYKFKVVY